jgi:hypothetical protein
MMIAICPQLEARRTHLRDNSDDSLYNDVSIECCNLAMTDLEVSKAADSLSLMLVHHACFSLVQGDCFSNI